MDFSKLKRTSLFDRKSLVEEAKTSRPADSPASFQDFWNALPQFLKVNDLRKLVAAIQSAREKKKPIIWMMGAHVIKVGLGPWIIDAIENGFITAVAMNGAGIVHDFELALAGSTSEDVAESLVNGSFGMTEETGKIINEWIVAGAAQNQGLGAAIGQRIAGSDFKHKSLSILAAAHENGVPVTVHVAIGTDVIHHHPEASGEAIGKTSLADFHNLCETVSQLGEGGAAINAGSNVILPEVFLKALTTARNLCGPIHNFTTANFDMVQHYRPNTNVVNRPIIGGGQGFTFTGHHEIMLPLLFTALKEIE
ncbi:MAG: hypothetical protein P9L94_06875 [Candidatus Hinthialibacter antarcticus]|nr:hypothetical protein [Candidatus Hinthialibacter antarcticus]